MEYYKIPQEYYQRIHFVRPRFKGNIENVLLYMANECCKIKKCGCKEYKQQYDNAIKMFPHNVGNKNKTVSNWRTEIPALFAFYEEDKEKNETQTSRMAGYLNEEQDLTQFFKQFLFTFQLPGGHIKPDQNIELIEKGIKFKPAKLFLQVMLEGTALLKGEKNMSITAEEATYCILYDSRCTSGKKSPREIAKTILENRKKKLSYYDPSDPNSMGLAGNVRSKGDIVRYAGDILDYLEIACMVTKKFRHYSIAPNAHDVVSIFVKDETYFDGYDGFYGKDNISIKEVAKVESKWFNYVNEVINPDMFKTDIRTYLDANNELEVVIEEKLAEMIQSDSTTKKDIGNVGEALVVGHEKMRLKLAGYDNLLKLVQVVDSPQYHPGFDIDSYEGDGTNHHRYIEVKTTMSKSKIQLYNFHLSDHEWNTADTLKEHYCVYRLMLSREEKILYILRNPIELYKQDKIGVMSRNGMEVSFNPSKFNTTKLLLWKD